MKEQLIFYTTLGCHLCEDAKAIYTSVLSPEYFSVEEVDIADSPALVDQYGTRIPVLKRCKDNTELNWPFTPQQLMDFLPE